MHIDQGNRERDKWQRTCSARLVPAAAAGAATCRLYAQISIILGRNYTGVFPGCFHFEAPQGREHNFPVLNRSSLMAGTAVLRFEV